MIRIPFARLLAECKRLESEERYAEALDLLEENFSDTTDREPSYWKWKGSLLLHAGRHQEAERTLREVLVRPEWPEGHPGLVRWLCEVLVQSGRFEEVERISASWASRGDLECTVMQFRAMLALGKAVEAVPRLRHLADSARGHVGIQLLLLEAMLDLASAGKCPDHPTMSARCIQRLRNMRNAGVPFSRYEISCFENLVRRTEGPFGFGQRRAGE